MEVEGGGGVTLYENEGLPFALHLNFWDNWSSAI